MYENIYDYRCQWLLWILHWGKGFCNEDMLVTPILHPTRNGCFNDCKALERKEFVDVLCFKTPLYSSSKSMMPFEMTCLMMMMMMICFAWLDPSFWSSGNIKRWAISPFPGAKLELMYDLVGSLTSEIYGKGSLRPQVWKLVVSSPNRLE